MEIHQQHHGYLRGHQLLGTSIKLEKRDQEVIDRLSDIAGAPEPSEILPTYLAGYPLPSGEHFVFARTWYDPDAPRAGCVLTHSLIVPARLWSTMAAPSLLRRLHAPFPHADTTRLLPLNVDIDQTASPHAMAAGESSEIVEALFLEQRQPVLWLNDNVEGAALRIIDALWPALRSQFAFQTYALKIRFIDDRPFDLLVAPRGARGRFAGWPGRRVEGGSAPRHAWTSRLASAIFEADSPKIASIDPLGLLRADATGDPAKLRLSLLWSDLEAQAESTPQAILGMLDILVAADLAAAESERLAVSLLERAMEAAISPDFAGEPSRYISILLDKLSEIVDSTALDAPVASAMARLLSSNPHEAALLLDVNAPKSKHFGSVTRRAAVGILEHNAPRSLLSAVFDQLSPAKLRRLLDISPSLAAQLLGIAHSSSGGIDKLAASIQRASPRTAQRLRGILPRLFDRPTDLAVLATLMSGASDDDVGRIVHALANTGMLGDADFMGEVLREGGAHRTAIVRETIIASDAATSEVAKMVFATLLPTSQDLTWVLDQEAGLGLALVNLVFERWKAFDISRAVRGVSRGIERLFPLLFELGLISKALQLLRESEIDSRQKVSLLLEYAPAIPEGEAEELTAVLLSATLPVREQADLNVVRQVLELPGALRALHRMGPAEISEGFFALDRKAEPLAGLALELVHELEPSLRDVFYRAVEEIVLRLSYWRTGELRETTYQLWAQLVSDAITHEAPGSVNAAAVTLEHAFANQYRPLSSLIVASFPAVYTVVVRRKSNRVIDRGFWSFERDKPGKLRRRLADAYYDSRWPPRDLAVMAEELGIADKIFDLIDRRWGGPDYLERLFNSLDPKRSSEERAARKRLRAYLE